MVGATLLVEIGYKLNISHSEKLLLQARELRDAGNYSDAIHVLENGVKKYSNYFELFSSLAHCYILTDNLEAAERCLIKARDIAPDAAEISWNTARFLIKKNQIQEALLIAEEGSQRFPNDIDGMGVLGVCLRASGNLDASYKILSKAILAKPDYAEAYINRGLISLAKQDNSTALMDLEKANQLKPHLRNIWNLIIKLRMENENYEGAILLLEKTIEINSRDAKIYSTIAYCHQKLENFTRSREFYLKAISIAPHYAEAYLNLGNTYQAEGKLEDSKTWYIKAIELKQDFAQAYVNLGNTIRMQGKANEAIEFYHKALEIDANLTEPLQSISVILADTPNMKMDEKLLKTVPELLLKKTLVRPKYISANIVKLLRSTPEIQYLLQETLKDNLSDNLDDVINCLTDLPLLLGLMDTCPIADLELEGVFTSIRSSILIKTIHSNGNLDWCTFQESLAQQCFLNEYIYNVTELELDFLLELETKAERLIIDGSQPNPNLLLCLASYQALHEYSWYDKLVSSSEVEKTIRKQITEPREEEELKLKVETFDLIDDQVSLEVKKQYEHSPYPRWVSLAMRPKPTSIAKFIDEIGIKIFDDSISSVKNSHIFIAGCGTGQDSIETASRFENSDVIAIDLSMSSLAYAKRKANEFGLNNIKYIQGDILKLGRFDKEFDIIESMGVLHHMAEPLEGWRILVKCLRKGGLMKVGLYSNLARTRIKELRSEISVSGKEVDDTYIRRFRQNLIAEKNISNKDILSSLDFFTLSECRDLLFHVSENYFTIPQLNDCLNELGLKFCGFETDAVKQALNSGKIASDSIYDLENWIGLEEENPMAFGGMYQFWCQKISSI